MGHWRYDCATHAVEWFSGHDKLFGISKEEFGGNIDAVQEMVHPDDRAHGMANIQKAIENHVPFDNTYRVTHRDGSIHWLHSYGHVFDGPDGRPDHIFGVTQDITHRKTTELELERRGNKLRELAEELTRCEERQRRDMALRLHDGVGQLLSVVKMKLREREVQAESLAQERELAAIRGIVEQALADTRTLTGELASPLLYEAGLVPALGWLLEQFQQRHPDLRFHLLDSPEPDHRECRLLLFQIARELLFNVVKHAGAGQAWVGLAIEGPWIRMRVRDDGVGGGSIADLAGMRTDCGFGLFSIRERIGMHGGELDVNSPPGGGTEVTVTYPLSAKDKPA
jgi:PAS domain S-box-containing protein